MDAGARVTQEQLPCSCPTGVVSEGLNMESREESFALNNERADRLLLDIGDS